MTQTPPHAFERFSSPLQFMAAFRQDVVQLVLAGLREFNALQPPAARLPLAEDTALLGGNQSFDSLAVVNLVAAVEEAVQTHYGVALCLSPELPNGSADDPWRNVGALADFIAVRINVQASSVRV